MKYRELLFDQLKSSPYFSKKAVCQLSEPYGIKTTTVDAYISRSLNRREILPLKKGLYVSADFYNKNKGTISYLFYLANVLRTPSYVSSWAALQYYNLTTEVIHIISSVTPKITRSYETKAGNFAYQSIQKELFSGFFLENGEFDFFIASPSKALFDLLYFKTRQFRSVRFEEIRALIADLRIDIDEMGKEEENKFYSMVKNYMHHE